MNSYYQYLKNLFDILIPAQSNSLSNCLISIEYPIKLHHFNRIAYQIASFQSNSLSNCIISIEYPIKLPHFNRIAYQIASFHCMHF